MALDKAQTSLVAKILFGLLGFVLIIGLKRFRQTLD
jgi:hypothetical protein